MRASIPASTGYRLATFAVTAAVGLGFSAVVGWNPLVFDILRYGGAAYVMWLALALMRAGAVTEGASARPASALDGAVLLVLNPKAWLIIALMFTQFLAAGADPARVLWITAVFTINNLVAAYRDLPGLQHRTLSLKPLGQIGWMVDEIKGPKNARLSTLTRRQISAEVCAWGCCPDGKLEDALQKWQAWSLLL